MPKLRLMLCLTCLTLASCGFGLLDDENDGQHSWGGQLVQDCTGDPAPHRELILKSYRNKYSITEPNPAQPSDVIIKTEGSDITDVNGIFSIEYKVKSLANEMRLFLLMPDGNEFELYIGDSYSDLNRGYAIKNCVRTQLTINNPNERDTIYIGGLNELFTEYDSVIVSWVDNSDLNQSREAAAIPLNQEDLDLFYETDFGHRIANGNLYYGFSIDEIRKSFTNRLSDSITDGYNAMGWQRRGYPYTDSLVIDLN